MKCVCSGCMPCYVGVLSVRSMEYCTGLFVWGLEVCAHLFVGGVCSGDSWWRFKVLGVVCVCDQVSA